MDISADRPQRQSMFDANKLPNRKAEADKQETSDNANHAGSNDRWIESVILNGYPRADECNSRRRYNCPKDHQ